VSETQPDRGIDAAWTGGQYSLYRISLALAIAVTSLATCLHGDALLTGSPLALALELRFPATDWPGAVHWFLAGSILIACLLLALGWRDRIAAVWIFFLFPVVWAEGTDIRLGGLFHLLLLFHLRTPSAPFGSWSARARLDPAGDWHMPRSVTAAAWALFLGFALAFDPITGQLPIYLAWPGFLLCLFAGTRPWGWLYLLALELIRFGLAPSWGICATLPLIHLCFRPDWLPAARPEAPDTLFYDGTCGLCHRFTRFLLAEDRTGDLYRFAPLQGETIEHLLDAETRARLPDSVVVHTTDGKLLTKSDAALTVADQLGGTWRVPAFMGRLVPKTIRDGAYDLIAAIRHRLFSQPKEMCPLMPPDLRARFVP